MSQLMKSLFATLDRTPPSWEERQAVQAAEDAVTAAQQRLTNREFEALWDAISHIDEASEMDTFSLGFRLGVQLTLEGLRPVYPTDPTAAAARPYPPQ